MKEVNKITEWDNKFLKVCNVLASWSNCLSRKIGAIAVIDKTIIATGFNGPPRGSPHCGGDRELRDPEMNKALRSINSLRNIDMCPRKKLGYGSGEGLDMCPAAHGEANVIANAARTGTCLLGATMYMNCGIPCRECLKLIINAGISEIVCTSKEHYDKLSKHLLRHSNLTVRTYGN